jgi:hypothetical protein
VIWAETGHLPWIWLNGKRCLQTKHPKGIIHFTLLKDMLLSYGIADNCFTINLHNYRTQQLISERTTDKQISAFLILS